MNHENRLSQLSQFKSLRRQQKIEWLGRLVLDLTICARETYESGGESLQDPVRMRRINELMHRVADQLQHLICETEGRPEEVFVAMLSEELKELGIQQELL